MAEEDYYLTVLPFVPSSVAYRVWDKNLFALMHTSLQSMMNVKLSKQTFRHRHKNRLIKTIQAIPHNLYVSVKVTSLYCGLRLILVYPNP